MKAELVWVLMSWVAGGNHVINYSQPVVDQASCDRMQKAAYEITAGRYYEGHKCVQILIQKEEQNAGKQSLPVETKLTVVVEQARPKKKR